MNLMFLMFHLFPKNLNYLKNLMSHLFLKYLLYR
jgi:hypothetical protein